MAAERLRGLDVQRQSGLKDSTGQYTVRKVDRWRCLVVLLRVKSMRRKMMSGNGG